MNKFLLFGLQHKIITALVVIAVSIYAIMGLVGGVPTDFRVSTMTNEKTYKEFKESVGSFDVQLKEAVFAKLKQPLTSKNIRQVWDLQEKLVNIPGVEDVESIFNQANYYHTGEYLNIGPAIPDIDIHKDEIDQQIEEAKDNVSFTNQFIAKDGSAVVFYLVLDKRKYYRIGSQQFKENIDAVIADEKNKFDHLFQIGEMRMKQDNLALVHGEFQLLLPIAMLVFIIITYFFHQSLLASINPMVIAGLTTLWTFGIMGHLDVPMNPMTVILPILFFVISSTEDIHLYSYYSYIYRNVMPGGDRALVCDMMLKKVGKSTLLMVITTFLGFAISTLNENKMLSDFAFSAAFGIGVNGILTLYLSPIIYTLLGNIGPEKNNKMSKMAKNVNEAIYRFVHGLLEKFTPHLLVLVFVAVLASVYSISGLKFSDNPMAFFNQENQLVIDKNMYESTFSGRDSFRIKLTLKDYDSEFIEPEILTDVENMVVDIEKLDEWDSVDSITRILTHVNREANNGEEAFYKIPDTVEAVESIFSLVGSSTVNRYLVEDHAEMHLTVRHHISERADLQVYSDHLEKLLDKKYGKIFNIQFSNIDLVNFAASKQVVVNQAHALIVMLLLIACIFTFLFSSIWVGLISLIPNLIPVTLALGLMPVLGVEFTVMTSIVVLVGVGLAVDDTIHFITKYQDFCQVTRSNDEAIDETLKHEIPPIVTTSAALILGFLCLSVSEYEIAADFGLMLAITIFFATAVDLIVTPVLVSKFRFVNIWNIMSCSVEPAIMQSQLFAGLYNYEIKIITGVCVIEDYKSGDKVRYDSDEEAIFFVLGGKIICKSDARQIEQSKPGSLLAVINMLLGKSYEPDLTAIEDSRVLIIHRPALLSLAYHYPRISYKLVRNLLRILAEQNLNIPKSIDTNAS